MNHTEINERIGSFFGRFNLSDEAVAEIASRLHPLHLKKGDFFSKAGKKCTHLGILFNGLLIAKYNSDSTGKETVSRFFYSPRNIVVTSFESFSLGIKANESIEAIEDSFLFCISSDELQELYQKTPDMNVIGRELAEQSYIQALQRIHDLQALTVEERMKHFFKHHSDLFNRVQRQHLCSYLGTNRNSLSRFLNKQKG